MCQCDSKFLYHSIIFNTVYTYKFKTYMHINSYIIFIYTYNTSAWMPHLQKNRLTKYILLLKFKELLLGGLDWGARADSTAHHLTVVADCSLHQRRMAWGENPNGVVFHLWIAQNGWFIMVYNGYYQNILKWMTSPCVIARLDHQIIFRAFG